MADSAPATTAPRFSFLPPIGSRGYYVLLGVVAIFILGPLGGLAAGLTLAAEKAGVAFLGAISFSASTFGAGMIVGARIGVPAIVVGLIGLALTPWLREVGLLGPHDPWRKVGFLISLGTILGAAIVDITQVVREALARHGSTAPVEPAATEEWKRVDTRKLLARGVFS